MPLKALQKSLYFSRGTFEVSHTKLYQMRQETSRSISYYYSQTSSMWEQLFIADPPLRYPEDIELFAKYRDHRRFMNFMMGLH